jgi:hypothetical protein
VATLLASVGAFNGAVLSSTQTGNGSSTNVVDRGGLFGSSLLTVVTTIGATPSVLIDIQGSADLTDWWNVPYADIATPGTVTVAQLGPVTTATTLRKILSGYIPWRFLRLNYSSNTNVTLTATIFCFPG